MTWLLWATAILAVLAFAMWLADGYKRNWREVRVFTPTATPQPQWQPGPYTPPPSRPYVPGATVGQHRQRHPEPAPAQAQSWQTTINRGAAEIDRLVAAGDWDSARAALQHVAYGMVDADPEAKRRFTQAMCRFAAQDPLYRQVMAVVRPLVAQTPGIVQAKLYPHLPDVDPALIRYALYYAAEMGDLARAKKGNSYALHIKNSAAEAIQPDSIAELLRAAEWANIDPGSLTGRAEAIAAALDSGSSRELDRLLRTVCPDQMWDWPAYTAYANRVSEKPTRLRMVAALAHRILRDDNWSRRMPQLIANLDNRPLWQFRAVGDSRDPPACAKHSGRTERFYSEFWQLHNPAACNEVFCRCTIRAYGQKEFDETTH
jgi:hypothetical protein